MCKSLFKQRFMLPLFFGQIILTLLFIGATYIVPQFAVEVRFFLFGKNTNNLSEFYLSQQEFNVKYSFRTATKMDVSREYLRHLHDELDFSQEFLDVPSHVEMMKRIVMTFSLNGGQRCGSYSSVIDNFKLLKQGIGCCADHSAALMVAAADRSIFVREVHHKLHTFNEYYDPDLKKWVWVDPMFAVMARDKNGKYLSLFEFANAMGQGEKVNFDFFGTSRHVFSALPPETHTFYKDARNFEWLSITLGNNVLEYDEFRSKINWLPKAPQQFAAFFAGVKPGYLVYHKDSVAAYTAEFLKYVGWMILILYSINAIYLALSFFLYIERKISMRRSNQLKVIS